MNDIILNQRGGIMNAVQKVEIMVKSFKRRFDGDTSYTIDTITVKADCLNWWKTRSGKGAFEIISVKKL